MKEDFLEIPIAENYSVRKSVRKLISERINPKIWQWDYLALKQILSFLALFACDLKKEKTRNILDVGCGVKPYKKLFSFCEKYVGIDACSNKRADVVCDSWDMPFRDNEFDALISTQVLEHTKKISETVTEIKRVVKNGGLIFISAPLVYPEHEIPDDFYRFTRYGLRAIFKDFDIIEIRAHSGFVCTLLRLWNVFLHYIPGSAYFLFPLFIFNNILGISCDIFARIVFLLAHRMSGKKYLKKFMTNIIWV